MRFSMALGVTTSKSAVTSRMSRAMVGASDGNEPPPAVFFGLTTPVPAPGRLDQSAVASEGGAGASMVAATTAASFDGDQLVVSSDASGTVGLRDGWLGHATLSKMP